MAVTRRGYIFGAFFSSILSVLLIVLAVASDSWIVSTATDDSIASAASHIKYGLFNGELELNNLATPTFSPMYMTCVSDVSGCAMSCKLNAEARKQEVEALANRTRPNPGCTAITTIDSSTLLDQPAIISLPFYVCLLLVLFVQLLFAVIAAALAIINATKNPTEPIFGLPGCLWSNVVTACLGTTVLFMFGIYYATSGLKDHLAFSYIAVGLFQPGPGLGYSYWVLIVSIICSMTNIVVIELRKYLLERDRPPPTIKVENHSDGTIFLY